MKRFTVADLRLMVKYRHDMNKPAFIGSMLLNYYWLKMWREFAKALRIDKLYRLIGINILR